MLTKQGVLIVMLGVLVLSSAFINPANAYTRMRGGCQYFNLEDTFQKSDLVFIGFLKNKKHNHLEKVLATSPQTLDDETAPRLSMDLIFKPLQIWKGSTLEEGDITIRERYIVKMKSRFNVGNTYLIFLSKEDEWGDDGWRIYECSKYEDIGRGNAFYVAKALEKHMPNYNKANNIEPEAGFFVNSGSLGDLKIFK
ncbi:MAG: hypothetical protein MK052_12420 [Alphaproteobacteria bacterium]|nr:hypothetical protein [Alphaproteobacteria bacterium]